MSAPILLESEDGGTTTRILSMLLEVAEQDNHLLRLDLPPLIAIDGGVSEKRPWHGAAIETIARGAQDNQQGYFALATRLAEVLFIDVIRDHLITNRHAAQGWLRASADERLARALSAMHNCPERPWTVAELAREAGMSRSSFAQHFSDAVGEAPLAYLRRWRMSIAREWIAEGRTSIKRAAERMGYTSEKAFSHAFRRTFGHPPSSFRPARLH